MVLMTLAAGEIKENVAFLGGMATRTYRGEVAHSYRRGCGAGTVCRGWVRGGTLNFRVFKPDGTALSIPISFTDNYVSFGTKGACERCMRPPITVWGVHGGVEVEGVSIRLTGIGYAAWQKVSWGNYTASIASVTIDITVPAESISTKSMCATYNYAWSDILSSYGFRGCYETPEEMYYAEMSLPPNLLLPMLTVKEECEKRGFTWSDDLGQCFMSEPEKEYAEIPIEFPMMVEYIFTNAERWVEPTGVDQVKIMEKSNEIAKELLKERITYEELIALPPEQEPMLHEIIKRVSAPMIPLLPLVIGGSLIVGFALYYIRR